MPSKRSTFIKAFILATLSLSLVTTVHGQQFHGREERGVAEMYDQDDLSACSLFVGNFINFGFWEFPTRDGEISASQRIESERNMYRLVARKLEITGGDRLLEVACGQGVGAALVMAEFKPKEVHGIDLSQAQIARAKKVNADALGKNAGKIFFLEGSAEDIPYASSSFDKLFSVEAAQHFENLDKFAKEANRILKPGGKMVIASFFGTSEKSSEIMSTMVQTIRDGIDKATPIYRLQEILNKNGFQNVHVESIGKNVYHGFDQWTAQGDLKDSWTRNWYKGYQSGLIDYYLITAEKSTSS